MPLNSVDAPLFRDVGVLAFVPDRWSELWQPRHQVLTRLARYFHVVWMNPAREWREWFHASRWAPEPDQYASGAFRVYEPDWWLPKLYRPGWLADLALQRRLSRARDVLTRRGCSKIVLYLWRPEFAPAVDALRHDVSCYHIDDEYSFSYFEEPQDPEEARLIERVDQVIIHSRGLLDKKGSINPNTAWVPNGVDYEAYAAAHPEPADLATVTHPRIGYTGFVKRQLDWVLIRRLAESHAEWQFVFVGPRSPHADIQTTLDEIAALPNAHFLGSKSVRELAAYPQHYDVCIMPYDSGADGNYIYPLKLHEYLASGRPVVSAPLLSLEGLGHVVSVANSISEWSLAIADALSPEADSAEQRAARQAVARRHDWEALVTRIAGLLAEQLGEGYAKRLYAMAGPDARSKVDALARTPAPRPVEQGERRAPGGGPAHLPPAV